MNNSLCDKASNTRYVELLQRETNGYVGRFAGTFEPWDQKLTFEVSEWATCPGHGWGQRRFSLFVLPDRSIFGMCSSGDGQLTTLAETWKQK